MQTVSTNPSYYIPLGMLCEYEACFLTINCTILTLRWTSVMFSFFFLCILCLFVDLGGPHLHRAWGDRQRHQGLGWTARRRGTSIHQLQRNIRTPYLSLSVVCLFWCQRCPFTDSNCYCVSAASQLYHNRNTFASSQAWTSTGVSVCVVLVSRSVPHRFWLLFLFIRTNYNLVSAGRCSLPGYLPGGYIYFL